ncbi:probable arabinosyltransferase ARAD1 isoform X2 [Diospyros lotus]|uniref:probable arabinosyltransferase ARAD1 isoform X2 n=1 Tax=Diospyros lotus TaxID=55363 RepID=UPI00224CB2A4|nr:probable arabinosyltransferase ARAD1 isoform X2 [Diospyros lotus]
MKVFGKTVLSLVFILVLTITYSIFIGTVDFRSHVFPLFQSLPTNSTSCRRGEFPLRVYMYDLPRRFNVGMLNRRKSDQTPVTAATLPPWPANSGLKKQHSVEYWMMASLLYDGDGGGGEVTREAVRVSDPESADVFFVPFFSSLSFNTHGHNMTDPDTEFDRQLQVDMLKFLRESIYWQRSGGRDHVVPMHHPNAFRFLREQWIHSPMMTLQIHTSLVQLFFSSEGEQCGKIGVLQEGIVRAKLAKILVGIGDVHYERSYATGESIKMSSEGMRLSKFCLHPAGDTPSSCRLFDAIVSHCVPVIVSDQIELPFEDELDYTQFSLFFSVKEALVPGNMVAQLRKFPKERWLEMWRRLKNISRHFEFQYPPKKEDAVNMIWRQVKHKVPAAKLAVHRSRRLKVPDWWRRRR